MTTLKDWFGKAHPPIAETFVDPAISPDLLGLMPQDGNGQPASVGTPPPQRLYNLGAYWTPFRALWKRPRNVLQG